MNGTSSSSRNHSPSRKVGRSNRLIKRESERPRQSLTDFKGRENVRSPSPDNPVSSMVALEGRSRYRDAAQESFSSTARFRSARERQSSPPPRSSGGIVRPNSDTNDRRQQSWTAQNGRSRGDRDQRQFPDARQRSTVRSNFANSNSDHSRFPKAFPDTLDRDARRPSFQNRRHNNSTRNRHEQDSWERATGRVRARNDPRSSTVTRNDSSLSKKSDGSTKKSLSTSSRSSNHVQKYRKKETDNKPSEKTETSSSANSTTDETRTDASGRLKTSKGAPDKTEERSRASSAERNGEPVNGASHSKEDVPSVITSGKWIQQISSSGKPYYFNTVTRKSVWTKPDDWTEEERTPKDISNGANTSEREKSVPIKSQNKRRISEVEPSEISAPSARKVQKLALPTNLLGSPISDDTDEDSSVASPTPSEKMDVSDVDDSNCTARGSKNVGAASNRTSPLSRRRIETVRKSYSPRKEVASPPPSVPRRTKAPTKEDLKKLAESDDPEKRRTEKLERVTNWMSNLGGTPTEVDASPAIDQDPGSPVSSESYNDSPCSSRKNLELDSLLKSEEAEGEIAPGGTLVSPLMSNSFSRIQLPLFDLPDPPDSCILNDLAVFLNTAMTVSFRNSKMDSLEEERFRQLSESRLVLFASTGEKAVQMKSNLTDIRHKSTTTRSQTNDIMFLNTLENELWQSIHARPEFKAESSSRVDPKSADVRLEPVELLFIKEEPVETSNFPELKPNPLDSMASLNTTYLVEGRKGVAT